MSIKNRNVKAPTIAADAIDISKIDLEADPNTTLGVTANRYLQLPTLATGELVTAAAGYNGAMVYDTTTNGLKACINGSYVTLGAGGATNAFLTVVTGAGTNPVADSATDTLTLTGTEITVTGDSATDTATFSITALAVTAAKLATTLDISGKTLTLPTSQTLTTPTIASFTNATHNHSNDAGGGTLSSIPTLAGTNSATFTIDADSSAAKVAIDTNSATGGFTATIVPPNLSASPTITLPAATGTLATLAGTETLAAKTLTAPVINGATSSGSTALNFGSNSGAFTTSTGTNTLSGNVAIPADKTFAQSGTGTFGTGTGAISLNGDVTIASAKNLAMSGAATLDTGTGAIGLNGNVTIATTKALNLGTGTAIGGAVNIYRDGAGAKSVAIVPGTSITLVDNVVQTGAYTFGTGTSAVSLNGDTTIATTKALNLGTASAIGGAVNIYRDGAGAKSVAIIPGTSITIVDNFAQSGAYTFGTGTGAVSLNGDITVANGKTYAMTGAGTFGTGTGAVSLNGDITVADGKDYAMTGAGTFGTGTGAVSINGSTTIATAKSLTMGSGTAIAGAVDIYRDGAGAKSIALIPGTSLTIKEHTTLPAGYNFAVTDGTVGLGSGAISTTYATMVTNLNADQVDGRHLVGILAPSYICCNVSGALGAATVYAGPGIETANTTEENFFIAPTAGTITKMFAHLGTAPGGADTVTFSTRVAEGAGTVTCVISAGGTTANDVAHTDAVTAGQVICVKAISTAATAADASVTLEFIAACQ